MITVFSDNREVPVNKVTFSDGAITFKLDTLPEAPRYIAVNVDPRTPVKDVREEIGMICDCIDSLKLKTNAKLILNIPYFIYARCDRIFEKGNPAALASFCYWLRDYIEGFDEIHTCDVHNEAPVRYILGDRLHVKRQLSCYRESLPFDFNTKYNYIISPDKGAVDKARTIASHLETDVVFADKKRDISTGRIIDIVLPKKNFVGAKCLIPDDICDYGGTFIGLAKKLKDAGAIQVDLYVTHLIAGKGLECLDGAIDKVYYYQTVGTYVNDQDVLNYNLGKGE
jgi:ribose-phosphate pyrophosphokinase